MLKVDTDVKGGAASVFVLSPRQINDAPLEAYDFAARALAGHRRKMKCRDFYCDCLVLAMNDEVGTLAVVFDWANWKVGHDGSQQFKVQLF
jgi:hypothetical protein